MSFWNRLVPLVKRVHSLYLLLLAVTTSRQYIAKWFCLLQHCESCCDGSFELKGMCCEDTILPLHSALPSFLSSWDQHNGVLPLSCPLDLDCLVFNPLQLLFLFWGSYYLKILFIICWKGVLLADTFCFCSFYCISYRAAQILTSATCKFDPSTGCHTLQSTRLKRVVDLLHLKGNFSGR